MTTDTPELPRRWLRLIIIGWSSFAVASVATMLFFASFDPVELAAAATFPVHLSRFAGYTLGFMALWALVFTGSLVSAHLIDSLYAPHGKAEA